MANDPRRFPIPQNLVPVQLPHTPTGAEVAEVEKVRGMQIRKDAVALAVEFRKTFDGDVGGLMVCAERIEAFILGTE